MYLAQWWCYRKELLVFRPYFVLIQWITCKYSEYRISIGSFCIHTFNVGSWRTTFFIFPSLFFYFFFSKNLTIPVYQYFSSNECSNDGFRDPDFICTKSEVENCFRSDTDDEIDDLFRHRKRKLCARYVDDHNLREVKRSNFINDLGGGGLLFLRAKMIHVCLTSLNKILTPLAASNCMQKLVFPRWNWIAFERTKERGMQTYIWPKTKLLFLLFQKYQK